MPLIDRVQCQAAVAIGNGMPWGNEISTMDLLCTSTGLLPVPWLIAAIFTFYNGGRAFLHAYLSCINVPDALSSYHTLPVT